MTNSPGGSAPPPTQTSDTDPLTTNPESETRGRLRRRLSIDEIGDADIEAVVALWRACGLTRPWNGPYRDLDLARTSQNSTVLVARDEAGAVVGTVMTGFDGHRGWVYYLGVNPEARGEGIGRALMNEAERRLAALGAPKLQLMVRHDNPPALGFYASLGYQPQETTVLGRWLNDHQS